MQAVIPEAMWSKAARCVHSDDAAALVKLISDHDAPLSTAREALLLLAADTGALSCARELLSRGADPGSRRADGEVPVDLARVHHPDAAELHALLRCSVPLTLSQLMRREIDGAFDALLEAPADRDVFDLLCSKLMSTPCPRAPRKVEKLFVDAFWQVTGKDLCDRALPPCNDDPCAREHLKLGQWRALATDMALSSCISLAARLPPERTMLGDIVVSVIHSDEALSSKYAHEANRLLRTCGTLALAGTDVSTLRASMLLLDSDVEEELLDRVLAAAQTFLSAFSSTRNPPLLSPLPDSHFARTAATSALFDISAQPRISWLAVGDWGHESGCAPLAAAMAACVRDNSNGYGRGIDFVLFLGDNFYPSGVSGVDSQRFNSQWADIFLQHPELRVPHKIVMGNHDRRRGNGVHQIAYSDSSRNVLGHWQFRGECDVGRPSQAAYRFRCCCRSPSGELVVANFVVVDTCATQFSCRREDPQLVSEFSTQKENVAKWMEEANAEAAAAGVPAHRVFSIVAGHHPMYTNGLGHHNEGLCLRSATYSIDGGSSTQGVSRTLEGLDFETTLVNGGADVYFSGHDHAFQHTHERGIDHIVTGSAVDTGFWQGPHPAPLRPVDYKEDTILGFTHNEVEACADGSCVFRSKFVSLSGRKIHEVCKVKSASF